MYLSQSNFDNSESNWWRVAHNVITVYSIKGRELLARNAIMAGEITERRLNVVLCQRPLNARNNRREESRLIARERPKARQLVVTISCNERVDCPPYWWRHTQIITACFYTEAWITVQIADPRCKLIFPIFTSNRRLKAFQGWNQLVINSFDI